MPATDTARPPQPLAHSPAGAAALLGISRARVYQLINDGALGSVKLGRLRKIRHSELEAFLDRLEHAAGKEC